jgi:hypothetical protein
MTNSKGSERKRSQPNTVTTRHQPGGTEEGYETKRVCVLVEIRTQHFPNTSLTVNGYHPARSTVFCRLKCKEYNYIFFYFIWLRSWVSCLQGGTNSEGV